MLPCHIVKDLLPSYLDHLTGPETEADIQEHLASCPDCRAVRDAMAADLGAEKAPPPKLNFLKRLRWQQRLGAVLSVAVMLLCLVGLYRLEYCYDLSSTVEMGTMIREKLMSSSLSKFPQDGEVDVLETTTVKDRLFILYQIEQDGTFKRQGIYEFQRGMFGGYRFRQSSNEAYPLVITSLTKIGKQQYLKIYTANWPEEATRFAVFSGYHTPYFEGDSVPDPSTLTPVYEGTAAKSILQVIPVTEEQVQAGFYGSSSVVYYDAEGTPLDTWALAEPYQNKTDGFGGSGATAAETGAIYVWCGIVVAIGIIMTQYFLCPEPKKKREKANEPEEQPQ